MQNFIELVMNAGIKTDYRIEDSEVTWRFSMILHPASSSLFVGPLGTKMS